MCKIEKITCANNVYMPYPTGYGTYTQRYGQFDQTLTKIIK